MPGRGRHSTRRSTLVAFALVVGTGDGIGGEHGALESLVAGVGDVFAPDGEVNCWCFSDSACFLASGCLR